VVFFNVFSININNGAIRTFINEAEEEIAGSFVCFIYFLFAYFQASPSIAIRAQIFLQNIVNTEFFLISTQSSQTN
jgi:hypothetical protein